MASKRKKRRRPKAGTHRRRGGGLSALVRPFKTRQGITGDRKRDFWVKIAIGGVAAAALIAWLMLGAAPR